MAGRDSKSIGERSENWAPIKTLHQVQIEHVSYVLTRLKGNKMRSARYLDINIRTLRNWVYKYDELIKYRQNRPWFSVSRKDPA